MNRDDIAADLLAIINAALTPRDAYELDDVPQPRPNEYVEITVSRYDASEKRQDGFAGTSAWRLTCRYVAHRITNVSRMQQLVRDAFPHPTCITVDGVESTAVAFEVEDAITPDDGWFSGLDTFTFTL